MGAAVVIDFPMFEDDGEGGLTAMHHPFTSPKPEDIPLMDTDPGKVRANAYDMVINGVEVGGGSIRIHDSALQSKCSIAWASLTRPHRLNSASLWVHSNTGAAVLIGG